MERNEKGQFIKDTNKSVVSYKLTDATKLKLRSVMQMMSANNSVNYDEMFSLLADFYINQSNVNIQKRRKKLTEQKDILEKLEGRIERKLERIYKNQMITMWNYLSKFERRENHYNEKVFEMQKAEIEQLKKLAESTSERIQIFADNDGVFAEIFDIFRDALQEHFLDMKEFLMGYKEKINNFLNNNTKDLNTNFNDLVRVIKIVMGKANEDEIKTQEEMNKKIEEEHKRETKMKVEKEAKEREQEAQKRKECEQEEKQKLRWSDINPKMIKEAGYDYNNGIIYWRKSDKNNHISILYEKGKDTLVVIVSNNQKRVLPPINEINKIDTLKKGVEREFELLLAGKNYLTFW